MTRHTRRGGARSLAALALAAGPFAGTAIAQEEEVIELAPVEIRAPRIITPLPGVVIDQEQTTSNVQSATSEDISRSQSIGLTDFLNNQMQSVSVNDYQGNPFQQDLVFRGFSASPLIGTPQGLSVYFDGVRINEPFGEVVNWDMIPLNAISRMDLMPGSNPLFGLNTLGGALSLSPKTGFTEEKFSAAVTTGRWGRLQRQMSIGGNDGSIGGFFALNHFEEDGWRQNSPSNVAQYYGRVDKKTSFGAVGVSGMFADNRLTGNGTVPIESYASNPGQVFTSPDRVSNELAHFTVSSRFDVSDNSTLSAQIYKRNVTQNSFSGDFWDEWSQAIRRAGAMDVSVCPDGFSAIDGAIEVDGTGCGGLTPNGLVNFGKSSQKSYGISLQYSHVTETNQLVLGATADRNSVDFQQSQMLGFIQDDRSVILEPYRFDDIGLEALRRKIIRNNLTGSSDSKSVFFNNIWSIRPNLHLNFGLRHNRTNVKNYLVSDRPRPLYQFNEAYFNRPNYERCGAENDDAGARYYCTSGDYVYRSLNPSVGVSWLPEPDLNLYSNYSQGTRVPSAIELGCARDRESESSDGINQGSSPGCSIPTALSSDPFLPQVWSHTVELGVRGSSSIPDGSIRWNASVYRTELKDDILFVSMGSRNRGVFDTFGETLRQGFELSVEGKSGKHSFRASWSRIDATYESEAVLVNRSNSSSETRAGLLNTFNISPGDRIPGIPRDSFRLNWGYQVSDKFEIGLSMIAHSSAFVRGNENNEHEPVGTDSNGQPTAALNDPTITMEPGRRYVGRGKNPGYAFFNFISSYRFSPSLLLSVRVDNVFNKDYVTAGDLGLNPFAPTRWGVRDGAGFNYNSNDWLHTTFVGPGAPRAIWLTMNYTLDLPGR
ncbi:MAG: TonB-dependent receptor [Methyloversatilis discipulorum]|nr:TonB-dependent receptor [Methyloversatilis discipulorum]